jgi:hypothetical protein
VSKKKHSANLDLCRVSIKKHSAKIQTLPCVARKTLGKLVSLPSVFPSRHSAKSPSPSFLRHANFFLPRVDPTLGNVFAVCPKKNTRQRATLPSLVRRVPYAEGGTRQSFCRVFFGLCRVPVALGKPMESGSVPLHLDHGRFAGFRLLASPDSTCNRIGSGEPALVGLLREPVGPKITVRISQNIKGQPQL